MIPSKSSTFSYKVISHKAKSTYVCDIMHRVVLNIRDTTEMDGAGWAAIETRSRKFSRNYELSHLVEVLSFDGNE